LRAQYEMRSPSGGHELKSGEPCRHLSDAYT